VKTVCYFDTVELNNSFYRLPSEAAWAKRLASLAKKLKEMYIYFNNDIEGCAVDNARTLRSYLVGEAG